MHPSSSLDVPGTAGARDDLLITDPAVVAAHSFDRSGWLPGATPAGVVLAATVDDVVDTLRLATTTRTPVVVRGGGTGLSGGATATEGAIVLDVSAMNRIVDIAVADQLAVVQPGVITADLDRAATAHGLRYAPDPASVEISTIGGNIATNAGGLRCAKYGVTRDSVLGLDVVLADGRRISTGRRTIKGVSGYDLTGLFVGSEGTLGVIVGATLRLRPIPPVTATISAYLPDSASAVAAAVALSAAGLQPSVCEFVDAATLGAIVEAFTGPDAIPADAATVAAAASIAAASPGAFLLVQTDGYGAEAEARVVADVLAKYSDSVAMTSDPAEADALVAVRRAGLPALETKGRIFIEDIAVPRSRLAEAVDRISEISRRSQVGVYVLAHAGDGNLHPLLVADPERGLDDSLWATADEIFSLALELGGTLTGEHGIGYLKRAWLERELGPDAVALQHRVKAAFDPAGILNPGKGI